MELMVTSCDSLCERITVVENLLEYLKERGAEIESRKRNRASVGKMVEVECPRNSLEWNEEGFEGRKKRKIALEAGEVNSERRKCVDDVESRNEHLVTVIEHVESLGVPQRIHPRACKTLAEIESREQNLNRAHESLAARERKVDEIVRALDARIRAVEEREKEIGLKEERLRLELEDEKARKQQKLKDIGEIVERLESAENKVVAMREYLDMRLEEVECRENVVCESLLVCVKEGDLIMESIGKKMEELEKMRREFNSFQEEKMRELESKEKLLNEINEKAIKDARLRTEELIREGNLIKVSITKELEKFEKRKSDFNSYHEMKMREVDSTEQLLNDSEKAVKDAKLRKEELTREGDLIRESMKKELEAFEKIKSEFNSFQEKKLRELGSKEQLLIDSEKAVKDAQLRNEELIREGRESMKKELEEIEKIKSEFNSFRFKKMGDLNSKEQLLNAMSEKVANDAKLRNEKLIMHERSIYQLLKRLNLAKDDVEGLKDVVDQRFKTLVDKENVINSTSDWIDRRMDEADSNAKSVEVKKKSIRLMEDKVISKTYELREKRKKLDFREQDLQAWQEELRVKQKEVDSAKASNEQRLEKLDAREKSMSELAGKCFKEHQAKKKELLLEKDMVYKVARFLGLEEENLKNAIRELEFREKQMTDHVRKDFDESADLKFVVRMDGINLQMFLNDPGKNLVSMGDEIFKVLHLSSDPAKLVLDAMVGFYPPHLRKEDTALDVRRTCIALLKQLIKMSREIKPCVREEAMQVALAWKSKMRGPVENSSSFEALGFLLLLAAYDLASSFNKDEISTLLMMVSRHREETPELDRLFCFPQTNLTDK